MTSALLNSPSSAVSNVLTLLAEKSARDTMATLSCVVVSDDGVLVNVLVLLLSLVLVLVLVILVVCLGSWNAGTCSSSSSSLQWIRLGFNFY